MSLVFIVKTIQKYRKKPWKFNSLCSVQFIQLHVDTVQASQYKWTPLCMHDLASVPHHSYNSFWKLWASAICSTPTLSFCDSLLLMLLLFCVYFPYGCAVSQFIIILCNAVIFQNSEYQVVLLICDNNLHTWSLKKHMMFGLRTYFPNSETMEHKWLLFPLVLCSWQYCWFQNNSMCGILLLISKTCRMKNSLHNWTL